MTIKRLIFVFCICLTFTNIHSRLVQLWAGDAQDNVEGIVWENFNFMHTFNLMDDDNVDKKQCWSTCSNFTEISDYITANNEKSNICYGDIISCTQFGTPRPQIFKIFGIVDYLMSQKKAHTCVNCNCICQEKYDTNINPHWSQLVDSICLDNITADIDNHYVITGVRLARLNNTITFQVQHGLLMEDFINPEKVEWRPLPNKCSKIAKLTYDSGRLILNDVILPDGWLAVGVAFKRCSGDTTDPEKLEHCKRIGDPFYLSVTARRLYDNYTLGFENVEFTKWNFTMDDRVDLTDNDMRLSIVASKNEILSQPEKNYVTFRMTSVESGGRRTSVIPYVDIQKVYDTEFPNAVHGIGLYYKGVASCGGYIAPSIYVIR